MKSGETSTADTRYWLCSVLEQKESVEQTTIKPHFWQLDTSKYMTQHDPSMLSGLLGGTHSF
jgi:hypothetical protein